MCSGLENALEGQVKQVVSSGTCSLKHWAWLLAPESFEALEWSSGPGAETDTRIGKFLRSLTNFRFFEESSKHTSTAGTGTTCHEVISGVWAPTLL